MRACPQTLNGRALFVLITLKGVSCRSDKIWDFFFPCVGFHT